jgi:hypothetical protein
MMSRELKFQVKNIPTAKSQTKCYRNVHAVTVGGGPVWIP